MRRAVLALGLAACGGSTVPRSPPAAAESLVGVWGGEFDFDVGPSGALRVVETSGGWRATLGAIDVPLARTGDAIGGDVGTGRLRLRRAGDRLAGHWIQPRTVADPSYASPLAFVRDPDGAFRATVEPLRPTVHVYLAVGADGRAFVREPGHNIGRQFGALTVARDGDAVTLRDGDGKRQLHGALAGGHLRLTIDRFGLALDLTRRGRDDAPGFYPRPSAESTYRYTPPRDLGDGWRVGTLADVDLAVEPIRALVQAVIDAVPTSVDSPALHAILIARHGVLVVDEYFAGHRADAVHDTRSAGKSFSTTLAGIAIDKGALALTTPAFEAIGRAADDPRKRAITLAHLLSMSTGLACDDNDAASPGNEGTLQDQADWIAYTLALPVVHPAGEHGAYCSATMNLVGTVIAGPNQAWLPERLHADLMAPLGITRYYANLQPDGQGYFGGGLYVRTRDLAKLAQLFLDRGTWRGARILSADWVAASTTPHAGLNHARDYGYGWWITSWVVGGVTYDGFLASGNGGQLAIAIPALDLVVAFQAGNYGNYATWRRFTEELVPTHVITAAQRASR